MINLKLLRKKAGLTQQELADYFNLSQQTIYKYESGKSQPDLSLLVEFANFFDTSVDYLLGRKKNAVEEDGSSYTVFAPEEIQLIHKIRHLRPEIRAALDVLISEFL